MSPPSRRCVQEARDVAAKTSGCVATSRSPLRAQHRHASWHRLPRRQRRHRQAVGRHGHELHLLLRGKGSLGLQGLVCPGQHALLGSHLPGLLGRGWLQAGLRGQLGLHGHLRGQLRLPQLRREGLVRRGHGRHLLPLTQRLTRLPHLRRHLRRQGSVRRRHHRHLLPLTQLHISVGLATLCHQRHPVVMAVRRGVAPCPPLLALLRSLSALAAAPRSQEGGADCSPATPQEDETHEPRPV
mmetsp:Transcript_17850/g.53827  ORF Transcript_17850/g.53827 Transcript_17850/m.53827 type:complete len:241 (-) Transcript_17850:379-1101(-)